MVFPVVTSSNQVPSLGNGVSQPIKQTAYESWLEKLRAASASPVDFSFFTDWMGVRTRIPMLEWAPSDLAGTTSTALPVPDDGYRSEGFEYVSLARAFHQRPAATFSMVEVGAAWAPWTVSGLVHARELGIAAVGIALEADERKCMWAVQHAKDNGLAVDLVNEKAQKTVKKVSNLLDRDNSPEQRIIVVRAAGWFETTTVPFPDTGVNDMGTAVQTHGDWSVDYRGAHLRHSSVPAVSLAELLPLITSHGGMSSPLDLLHIDVQGIEFEMLQPLAADIQSHTRLMAVGTHSRLNEGLLQDFFLRRGWGLLIDEPCKAEFIMTHPTLSGFTWQDGMQLWENPFVL